MLPCVTQGSVGLIMPPITSKNSERIPALKGLIESEVDIIKLPCRLVSDSHANKQNYFYLQCVKMLIKRTAKMALYIYVKTYLLRRKFLPGTLLVRVSHFLTSPRIFLSRVKQQTSIHYLSNFQMSNRPLNAFQHRQFIIDLFYIQPPH